MPPPSSAQKKSLKELKEMEAQESPVPKNIVITGQPGSGKTTLAASLFSPEIAKRLAMSAEELKKQPKLELKGAVWVKTDAQALVSIKMLRAEPEFTLDYTVLLNEKNGNANAAIRDLHGYLEEAREAGAWGMVLDTATALGHKLEHAFVAGADNTMRAWGQVGDEYVRLYETCVNLGYRQVWLAQPDVSKAMKGALAESSKRDTDPEKLKLEKARAMATSVGENAYIVPALSGNKVMPMLGAQPSLSGWLKKQTLNGKTTRIWMPFGTKDAPGKNRYEKVLKEEEPADLYAMDQKILAAIGE